MRKIALLALCVAMFDIAGAFAQGKFSGYMFGDYFYNVARDTTFKGANAPKNAAVGGQKDLQAFQLRRIYFTYDNDISESFTTRFRLESDATAGSKETDANGKVTVFVKDAYLTWKNVFQGSNLIFGFQPSSAFDISETAWSYRSLEKTIMDLRGIIPSRVLGISLKGKIVESGMVNYWLTFANNSGTAAPNGTVANTDKYKRYSLNLQIMPTKEFQVTLLGDYLARPSVNAFPVSGAPPSTVGNGVLTAALFAGYNVKDEFNVGVEGFLRSLANGQRNSDTTGLTSVSTIGVTAFGEVNVSPELVVIARYDYYDPNSDSRSKGDGVNYIIAGLAYKPNKNVQIIPNVQVETYEKLANGRTYDPSVTGRVTFYYTFL